jgi:DNA end-binding protein Ku
MAAAARPYWTGFLKLSLVTISVRLYTATSERERIHFHQIHEESGERVRYQTVVPGLGEVDRSEIVKGYEYEKGHYVTIDPDDLKNLRLETTDTIDIVEFVEDIDPIYLDMPYYLVPDGSIAEEGFRLIRDALRHTRRIAVGQVVINGRERVVAIRPCGSGMIGNALHFEDEIRAADGFFDAIGKGEVDPDQLSIMEQIIDRKTRKFEPGAFVDHYQQALKDLVAEKLAGKLPKSAPARKPAEIINLMDALKKSLAGEAKQPGGKTAKNSGKKKTPAPSQRNLLLPVTGGRAAKGAKAASDKAASDKTAPAKAESAKRRKKA